jgi:(+)-trans-carveol dehydrogenase
MGKRLAGKVALITGAARGQGRSHAIRLAQEGADIIAVDIRAPIPSVPYPLATSDDLEATVKEVKAVGGRIVARQADVRDYEALKAAIDEGVAELGHLEIVSANAGINSYGRMHELSADAWNEMIGVNLTGVWHTVKAAIPHVIAGGNGGSIIITSSSAGTVGYENIGHYVAAKHGVIGLMKTLALELASHMIRVNVLAPAQVNTGMVQNEATYALFCPDAEHPGEADLRRVLREVNLLPVEFVEPVDVSNALLFLASDEARFITGAILPVDTGVVIK